MSDATGFAVSAPSFSTAFADVVRTYSSASRSAFTSAATAVAASLPSWKSAYAAF